MSRPQDPEYYWRMAENSATVAAIMRDPFIRACWVKAALEYRRLARAAEKALKTEARLPEYQSEI